MKIRKDIEFLDVDDDSPYIIRYKWFAWRPVKTNKGWEWWTYVTKVIDQRPEVYLGLMEEVSYWSHKQIEDVN